MILALALSAFAADEALPSAVVLDAMAAELARAGELRLPEAPKLYHARYHALLLDQVDAHASFGALIASDDAPFRAVGVELRVGDPTFDNTGFGGWQNGFAFAGIPARPTPRAIRDDLWRLTDRAYKQAVEQYGRKKAQIEQPPDHPGDYVVPQKVIRDLGGDQASLADPLVDLAVALSAAGARAPRAVERSEAWVGHEAGRHLIVDTEGSRIVTPTSEVTIRAAVHVRAADGELLTDARIWSVQEAAQLPARDGMVAEAEAMVASLIAAADRPTLDDEYVGPVVFEGDAAVDLFRWLLVPQLEGTPPEVPFDTWFGSLGDSGSSVRIGRRVLPPGWTVVDDPSIEPTSPASFTVDLEGVEAQRVALVTDGIVRGLVMSLTPRKEIRTSNGHARGLPGNRASGRVAELEVTPAKAVSAKKLDRAALTTAKAYGRDWWFVVRRLQEPAVFALDQGGWFDTANGALPPPVVIVKRFADGREEVLRGAAFAGVSRLVLRDLVAAGGPVTGVWMASGQGASETGLGPTEGLATWARVPSVLVGELELVPRPSDPNDVPVLPLPVGP